MSATTHARPHRDEIPRAGRPRARRIQAKVMNAVNVPMRRVLALPFRTPLSDRLMLLYLTGRKTGRSYRQPVSYVRDGETLLTPGGGNWKRNLVPGRPERIRLGGRDVLARPVIISDLNEIERLLAIILKSNPTAGRFVGVGNSNDRQLDRGRLEAAIRYGFRVVRWHLEEPRQTQRSHSRSSAPDTTDAPKSNQPTARR